MNSQQTARDDELQRIAELVTEGIYAKLEALFENQDAIIAQKMTPVHQIQTDIAELKSDMKIVKTAVTSHSYETSS